METHAFYLLGDVARTLQVPQHRITYLLTTRRDLEPVLRVGNRRLFSAQEVERVRMALTQKEKKMAEFRLMKEIGADVGLSSHQVGRRLKELGLRTTDGKPSREAFNRCLVQQHWSRDGANYCWAWDAERVKALLGVPNGTPESPSLESPTSNVPAN